MIQMSRIQRVDSVLESAWALGASGFLGCSSREQTMQGVKNIGEDEDLDALIATRWKAFVQRISCNWRVQTPDSPN